MRVIVVDDEVFVRKGIITSIPWSEYGIQLAGEAPNGQIGLELVREVHPQVVLTDLRMPVMDGLEMIRCIRSEFPDIKIIILSVREDFEGVQEALRLGVVDYIHKLQLSPESLLQCLLKIKASMVEQDDTLPFTSPLTGSFSEEACHWLMDASVRGEPQEMASASNYLLVKIEVHNSNRTSGFRLFNKSFLKALLSSMILKKVWESSIWFPDERGDLWIWLYSGETIGLESVHKDLSTWLNTFMEKHVEFPVSAGISLPFHRVEHRIEAIKQAEEALELSFHKGFGFIHPYPLRELAVSKDPQPLFDHQSLKKYLHAMEIGDFDHADEQLQLLFPVELDLDIPKAIVREGVYQWLSSNVALLRERIGYMYEGILDKSPFEQITVIQTYSELREWCMRFNTVTQEMLQRMKINHQRDEIRKAIEYILENYPQPIRVQDVAKLVHLSENYFSYLFSKVTGKHFIHYLQEVRVEKAKERIREGQLTWIDIGYATGFESPKYFSKIFKRYTGSTPAQYASLIQ
jgi:two-component system response regulator YesN